MISINSKIAPSYLIRLFSIDFSVTQLVPTTIKTALIAAFRFVLAPWIYTAQIFSFKVIPISRAQAAISLSIWIIMTIGYLYKNKIQPGRELDRQHKEIIVLADAAILEERIRKHARLVEEAREEARLAEEARVKEEARLVEEARLKEEARLVEEAREKARLAEEARVREEIRVIEELRAQETGLLAEEKAILERAKINHGHFVLDREGKEVALLVKGGRMPHNGPWPAHFPLIDKYAYDLVHVPQFNILAWIPLSMVAVLWDSNDSDEMRAARCYIYGRPNEVVKKFLYIGFPNLDEKIGLVAKEFLNINGAINPLLGRVLDLLRNRDRALGLPVPH